MGYLIVGASCIGLFSEMGGLEPGELLGLAPQLTDNGCTTRASTSSGWAMGGGRFNCGCDIKLHLSVVEFGLSHNGWHLAGQMHQ